MKDYYKILGIPENASLEDIKKAFRHRAFQCHPDKNPGREKAAETEFKEINEAYAVLRDPLKRQQFDLARSGRGGAFGGQPAFNYSQQDIFQGVFNDPAIFNEINQMFAQAGLRFDEDFTKQVFFSGRVMVFQFGGNRNGFHSYSYGNRPQPTPEAPAVSGPKTAIAGPKPGLMDRLAARMMGGIVKLLLRAALGPPPQVDVDRHRDFAVTLEEARLGTEKEVVFERNGKPKKVVVKVPAGVTTGTRIRLKGMGDKQGKRRGDLYLHIEVKDATEKLK